MIMWGDHGTATADLVCGEVALCMYAYADVTVFSLIE